MTVENHINNWRMGKVKTVGYCTFCLAVVGFIMLLAGAILSGVAYTEVRPNIADENYERYIRSDLKRVMGPVLLSFGILCILCGCIFFGCNLYSASREHRRARKMTNHRQHDVFPPTPDADKKMLSDA